LDPPDTVSDLRRHLLNTPAGSILVTFRIAVMAAITHMPTVSANKYAAIFGVITMVSVGTLTDNRAIASRASSIPAA